MEGGENTVNGLHKRICIYKISTLGFITKNQIQPPPGGGGITFQNNFILTFSTVFNRL